MSQMIKRNLVLTLILIMGSLALLGCGDTNTSSSFDTEAGEHSEGWTQSGHVSAAKSNSGSCTECHGDNFGGGITGVACSDCHLNGSPFALTACTSCHAAPPSGTTAPNRAGAHAVHNALPAVMDVCGSCHTGAGSGAANHFNGSVNVQFLASYNAKSGTATRNADGTCSNVSCHGGQTTPAWLTGTIDVNTQCTSCHIFGSSQYNSFSSGEHQLHLSSIGMSCTDCHGTSSLAANHFTSLQTTAMEGPASATINGVLIFSYTNGTCATECHEPRAWQ